MLPAPDARRARVLHVDINSFSFERFSNGATIQYREMLRRFLSLGIDGAVVTICEAAASAWSGACRPSPDRCWHLDQGIAVGEYLLDVSAEAAPDRYRQAVDEMLTELGPDLVIVNTPPARLEEAELLLFESLARADVARLCFVPDSLFPRAERTDPQHLSRLVTALHAFELVTPSAFIARSVTDAGLGPCSVFGNVFDDAVCVAGPRDPLFVTFVNPHPMKGVEIFLEVAKRLPHRQFQVVRAWPYPPEFSCDLPNVTIRPYTTRIADVWRTTAVLIVPSLCLEGFGRVVVEAQINGIPVVAHDLGGLSEACGDGAMLVPAPRLGGDPVFPRISDVDRDASVRRFCAHIEACMAPAGDDGALASRAVSNARRWIRRGEEDVARLAAPLAPAGSPRPSLLVLAPHPDDAAFSVGGLLRGWCGEKSMLTVFGQSNFTKAQGFVADQAGVSRMREVEDREFCRATGVALHYCRLPEASLRRGPCFAAIFGADADRHEDADRAARDATAARLAECLTTAPDLVLVPAALGGHCDHRLVRDLTLTLLRARGIPFALYEDLPYAADLSAGHIAREIAMLLAEPDPLFIPIPHGLDRKLRDAGCYASQVDRAVLDGIASHALRWPEPSERLWSTDLVAPVIARGLMGRT